MKQEQAFYHENNPLRVGILLNDSSLEDWEYLVLTSLFSHPSIQVATLIQGGKNIVHQSPPKSLLKSTLIQLIRRIEQRERPHPLLSAEHKQQVDSQLENMPTIAAFPKQPLISTVKQHHLDLILTFDLGALNTALSPLTTHGVWYFRHGDNNLNGNSPIGFWEVFNKQELTVVTLQRVTSEEDGELVVDKGYYLTYPSWINNKTFVLEKSYEILMKSLNVLCRTGIPPRENNITHSGTLFTQPSVLQWLRYMVSAYGSILFKKLKERILKPTDHWMLHIHTGDIFKAKLCDSKPIIPPRQACWADPFVVKADGSSYIFFENYDYKSEKANIACIQLENHTCVEKYDVIDTDYHMSYPQIVSHDGQYYMIPETTQKKRLEIWRCDAFPDKWSLFKTVMPGVNIADPTLFHHPQTGYWLFANITCSSFEDRAHLYLFKVDSPLMNTITPHPMNPIVTDNRIARAGGQIFIHDDGRIIRPSQRSLFDNYGYSLVFNEIVTLTLFEYAEKPIQTIYPRFASGMTGCHHYSGDEGLWCVDAKYKHHRARFQRFSNVKGI